MEKYIRELLPNATDEQLHKLKNFYEKLIATNKVMNLTTITSYDGVYIKHFYDSLLLTKVMDFTGKSLCDVGSGAGFPGIPLAIFTSSNIVIIDALQKRINFLNEIISILNLTNVGALHKRAEEYVNEKRESFDIVTARAVARLNILAELCLPLVRVGGYFIAMKGNDDLEAMEANNAIFLLGAKLIKTFKFDLPENYGTRNIYLYQKIKSTPKGYPRTFSKIKNMPL